MKNKNDIKEQKKGDYTHIVVVLDKSGSMSGLTSSTISGFNGFMKEQKNVTGKATVSLMQFATYQDWTYEMMPVKEVVNIDYQSYKANGGSTALCDSIARAVHRTEDNIKDMDEKPDNVVVVVITDGQENDSKEFNKTHVKKIIESHEEEGWDFVFLGANQDAIAEGGSMGVRATNAYTYAASEAGVQDSYMMASRGLSTYRTRRSKGDAGQIGFFVNEDEEETAE
jgi:uncharacterized protein YegL